MLQFIFNFTSLRDNCCNLIFFLIIITLKIEVIIFIFILMIGLNIYQNIKNYI